MTHRFYVPALVACVWLAGCAAMPADRGFADVSAEVAARGVGAPSTPGTHDAKLHTHVGAMLARPLSAADAVAIAFVMNPAVRAEYAQLGIAQAEVLDAARLSNPSFTVSALESDESDTDTQLGFELVQNFTEILFYGARQQVAADALAQRKREVGAALLDLAADVDAAYFELVARTERLDLWEEEAHLARARADLSERFHRAGNVDEGTWRLEVAAAVEVELQRDAARADAAAARSRLERAMGLESGAFEWRAASGLPDPVEEEDSVETLRALALERRLDLAAKRSEVAALEGVQALARRMRWLGVVDVGVEAERESDGERLVGPRISLQLPVFNQGQASIARTDAMVERARAELATLELAAAGGVTETHGLMIAERERARRVRDELVPARAAVLERALEQQNYMLIGQFELLAARAEVYAAHRLRLDALERYWSLRSELARRTGGALPSDSRIGATVEGAGASPGSSPPAPAPAGHSHHHH